MRHCEAAHSDEAGHGPRASPDLLGNTSLATCAGQERMTE